MLNKSSFKNKAINKIALFFQKILQNNLTKRIETLKLQRDEARKQRDEARKQRDGYISKEFSNISQQTKESKAWENKPKRHDRIALIIKKILSENFKEIRIKKTREILEILNPIITNYVEKNSISIVVPKKNIVVGRKNLDITNQIIILLNNENKSLKF